jgi:hypothetical protein
MREPGSSSLLEIPPAGISFFVTNVQLLLFEFVFIRGDWVYVRVRWQKFLEQRQRRPTQSMHDSLS